MAHRGRSAFFPTATVCRLMLLCSALIMACLAPRALGQQTLGSMNGTVRDVTGAVVPGSRVQARAVATNLSVSAESQSDGSFSISDLPIGTYEVTLTKEGFQTAVYPQIIVQGNRTATVNAKLKPGAVTSTVTVNATPLLNETDTTTGYTLDEALITSTPLGTGSFTQLATLSPGVSADLLNTAGTNAGLGNQAIWANGQRDTSNGFALNGVDATNIFNGKSTSQVTSGRVAVNIGQSSVNEAGGAIGTSTSVYGAIGQALPSPPPETIEEIHVNSAMYDASQGSNSGAQIGTTTKSGSNLLHGGLYETHQQTGWNANDWFFNQTGVARPAMHRNVFGGYLGGPIKKDKMFFFGSYQAQRVTDKTLSNSIVAVPPGLTDSNRDAQGLADLANAQFGTSLTAANVGPQALQIMNQKAPDGSWWVPNAATGNTLTALQNLSGDAEILGPSSTFRASQVNANVDYNFSARDRFSVKYYFQDDPGVTPFAQSNLLGFPQTMHAGSQTFSLSNITALTPNFTWEQRLGFIRQRAYGSTSQFVGPSSFGITIPGTSLFPGINIKSGDPNGNSLSIGPVSNFANAGLYQNSFGGGTGAKWVHGKHSFAMGVDYSYRQLNVVNKNRDVGRVTFADFPGFLQGQLCGPNTFFCGGQDPTALLSGASNRYYRARQLGSYVQDNIKVMSNLTLDLGLRWDWDGPLTEKYGNLTNFNPKTYAYDVANDVIDPNGTYNLGLVIAGNNKTFGTKGVSASTLTGKQWGFAPRIGLSYSPSFAHNVVIRAGLGLYYDRGEYFAELSPPAGGGISGPFGVTTEAPFVVPYFAQSSATFALPFGTSAPPPPPGNLAGVKSLIPNAAQLIANQTTYCNNLGESGCGPLFFGGYDPTNKLPYSENWTFDLQWQPRNDVVMTFGYVGNHGVHLTLPLPFNQAKIATAQNPALAGGANVQTTSYGYNVTSTETLSTLVAGFGTGNAALRVPYLGYDPNSVFNRAVGISNYDALQFNVTKRMSRGLQVSGSYTWSHTLDEQSALGLFFTGNDPNNPHSSYATSDFDRTHVLTVSYHYDLPAVASLHGVAAQIVNGWAFNGLTVLQSGQPYSVFDYTGGAASIYWGGGNDLATNPIVPARGFGSTQSNVVLQGTTGVNGNKLALNPNAFGVPTPYAPGTNGVPGCDSSGTCDVFENGYANGGRNIFRGPFQSRWDLGMSKNFKISERFGLKYDVMAFNLFNHPSFDIPNNFAKFNPFFSNPPFDPNTNTTNFAFPPFGNLGTFQHTIGSPRFIQMALHLTF